MVSGSVGNFWKGMKRLLSVGIGFMFENLYIIQTMHFKEHTLFNIGVFF